VDAAEKSTTLMVWVAVSSQALLFLILAGSALWCPTANRTDGAGLPTAEDGGSAAAEEHCADTEGVKNHKLPIPSDWVTTARFSS